MPPWHVNLSEKFNMKLLMRKQRNSECCTLYKTIGLDSSKKSMS